MWEKVRKLAVSTLGGDGGTVAHLLRWKAPGSSQTDVCRPGTLHPTPGRTTEETLPRSMRDTPGAVHCSVICGRGDGRTWVSLLGKHEEAKGGSGMGWGGV